MLGISILCLAKILAFQTPPQSTRYDIKLTGLARIELYVVPESDILLAKLIVNSGKEQRRTAAYFPVIMQTPHRIINAKLVDTNDWLIVCTELTPRNEISYCFRARINPPSLKLLFAEHSGGVSSSAAELRLGKVVETQVAMWIFAVLPEGIDRDTMMQREGQYNARSGAFTFTRWKPLAMRNRRRG